MKSPRPPKFRFSLITLLLVVTIVSLLFGVRTYLTKCRDGAVELITEANGKIIDKEEYGNDGLPNWLQKLIGENYFRQVRAVDFATNVYRIDRSDRPEIPDQALRQLQVLDEVEGVEFGHCTTLKDEQLVHLESLKNLKSLYLYYTQITGSGLRYIASLPQLEALSLTRTDVGDEGLKHIGKCKNLKWLQLDNTKVTDEGVPSLAELSNLESLTLSCTDLTNKSLPYLQKLTALKELVLRDTGITAKGIEKLKSALPNCHVYASFSLGKIADNAPLFPPDHIPTPDELRKALEAHCFDSHIRTEPRPEGEQIVSVMMRDSALSDEVVLDLVSKLPNLRSLGIAGGLVGDRLLEGLKDAKALEDLGLVDTRVSNDGLKHVESLDTLTRLSLDRCTGISDEGVRNFPTIYGLQHLSFDQTRVTTEAIEELRERLPGCRVEY